MKSYKIPMPHWPMRPLVPLAGNPLERMKELLKRLGDPQVKLPPVIHVAGTNGKGSTIAFLRAMLEAVDYKVHVYTAPHLIRFNERMVLAGEEIGDDALTMLIEETRQKAGDLQVEVFEGTTAAAMLAFSRAPADILLVETGMGGRFDPTNLVTPVLTIITPVSYDHQDYLGRELEAIAWHKAGIMKAGVPSIVSHQPEEVMAVMEKEAVTVGAPLYVYGKHWRVEKSARGFVYRDAQGEAEFPVPGLSGDHQLLNAGAAIAALTALEGFEVPGDAMAKGLQSAKWPGRLEQIKEDVWYDGGHNAAGAMAIRQQAEDWKDKPLYLIAGTTRGKDAALMLEAFADVAAATVGVPVAAEPDCYSGEEMKAFAEAAGLPNARAMDSVREAVDWLKAHQPPGRILVFGSLFFRIELK